MTVSKPFKISIGLIILIAAIIFSYPLWEDTGAGYRFCAAFGSTEFNNGVQTCTFLYSEISYSDLVDVDHFKPSGYDLNTSPF